MRRAAACTSSYSAASSTCTMRPSRTTGLPATNTSRTLPPVALFPAVCSACGRDTEVPFEPRSDKPVYCRECFQLRRTAAPPRNYNY